MVVLKADKSSVTISGGNRSRFLQTLVVIHTKMAIFWLVFSVKNPVKSDKLALIEGKVLNLMFLDINIPVVPIDIGQYKTRTADHGPRTGYKIWTRYKTRTGKRGLGIKHGQGIKRGRWTGYKIRTTDLLW